MNRKHLGFALVLLTALMLLWAGSAFAAPESLEFKMELSKQEFAEPATIEISFTVTNTGDSDMPGPVMLYYPDGSQVEAFGAPILGPGASKNWTGEWTVTQEELNIGKISFKVVYPEVEEDGEVKQVPVALSKRIQYKGAEPQISVERTIVPGIAEKGQSVNIIYEITNTGTVDISSLTIQEAVNNKQKASVGAVAAGETVKHTFTAKMKKKDMTSQATVTYKVGKKTYTAKVEAATIKHGKVNLTASLSADKKGGAPGDPVKLTLKLKNTGKTDFTDITATDEKLGTVFSGETVAAGKTVTLEKEIAITETQEILLTVRADSADGQVETATSPVKIVATDPDRKIALDVTIETDKNGVSEIPEDVRFTTTVTNRSAMDVENVTVKAVDMTLYTFSKIPAGESRSFTRDTSIQMAGTFRFTACVKDQLGETLSFESNAIELRVKAPEAEPTPTPVVLPEKPAEATVPPQPVTVTAPPEPAQATVPPQPEATGTEEENAKAREEWEAQAAAIESQNQQAMDEWAAQAAEIEQQNKQAKETWEAQAAEIEQQNKQAIADWEAEKERILNATPEPPQKPEPKAEGADVVDLSEFPLENAATETKTRAEVMNNGMLLLNEWHARPADFDESGIVSYSKYTAAKQKVQVDNHNIAMFPAAWDALLEATAAAKEEGLSFYTVTEGYRTWDKQNELFTKRKEKLASQYSNEEDLIAATKKAVNFPGTSEFNSGLSFTLKVYEKGNDELNGRKFEATEQGVWMIENSWKYGLVFRFPLDGWPLATTRDKHHVTGVSVQLKLFRYVGKGNAAFMHSLDMCLEEYISYLHEHPHLAYYEDGVLKYEVVAQKVGEEGSFALQVTSAPHVSSLDNMGWVITVFEY